MAYNPRKCLWFGTVNHMQWVATPLRGAESSPEGWQAGGTLLNGGGWQTNSWGSHKVYNYEWPSYSSPEVAQLMKSYADGSYGRGLLYFLDPVTYSQNILPARVADPSMAVGNEGASLVYGYDPTPIVNSNWQANGIPVSGAYYNLVNVPAGFRGVEDAVFVPIPSGYALTIGAMYERTGSGGIFVSPQNSNGSIGEAERLTATAVDAEVIAGDIVTGLPGVWIWLGKTETGASSVTARAITARLVPVEWMTSIAYGEGFYGEGTYGVSLDARFRKAQRGPWVGGMGHSGARFMGPPSFTTNTLLNGGQVGFAASFREVGSWAFG